MPVKQCRSRNKDRMLKAYFESRRDFYGQLLRCACIEEMRILFDLYAKKLAVQEWLYFMLMLSLNMQYPGRYSNVDGEAAKQAYEMVCAELGPGSGESYLDSIVTNGVFIKSMFQTISSRECVGRSGQLYFVKLFQLIIQKFPDIQRWNHFFKRSGIFKYIMEINCDINKSLV